MNISHQLFELTALEHKLKRLFCTRNPVLNIRYKDFWYTKINLSQKYIIYIQAFPFFFDKLYKTS